MPKVVPGNEINLPDAPEVRISTAKKNPGKILAVRHPLFGWLKYSEWTFLHSIGKLIDRIGPMEFVAWTGFTIGFKGSIDTFQDFGNWFAGAAEQAIGAFAEFAAWIMIGLGLAKGKTAITDPGVLEKLLKKEERFGDMLGPENPIQGFFNSLGSFFFPLGNVSEWFWAAIAGAISVLALKRGLSP